MTKGKKVLIVEDEPLIAMSIEGTIEDAGMTPVLASNVKDALTRLAETDVSAAILDYALRGESAEPIAAALRERRIPFIICSGSEMAQGVDPFIGAPRISKPFMEQELLDAVTALGA